MRTYYTIAEKCVIYLFDLVTIKYFFLQIFYVLFALIKTNS